MTRDIVPQLATLLNGLVVTDGTFSLTFPFVSWGRHYDRRNYAADRGVLTARETTAPKRPTNIGGGASMGKQFVDVHAFFEDNEDAAGAPAPADLDAFKRLVKKGIEDVIRANEKTFTDAVYVFVENAFDDSSLLGGETAFLKNEVRLLLAATLHEVY